MTLLSEKVIDISLILLVKIFLLEQILKSVLIKDEILHLSFCKFYQIYID